MAPSFSLTFDPKQENQHTEQSKIIFHVSVYMKSRVETFKEKSNKSRNISKLKNVILEKPQEVLRAVLIIYKAKFKNPMKPRWEKTAIENHVSGKSRFQRLEIEDPGTIPMETNLIKGRGSTIYVFFFPFFSLQVESGRGMKGGALSPYPTPEALHFFFVAFLATDGDDVASWPHTWQSEWSVGVIDVLG